MAERSPGDPHEGVRADIEALAGEQSVPGSISVSGVVYDVDTGRVDQVERRSPLRAS